MIMMLLNAKVGTLIVAIAGAVFICLLHSANAQGTDYLQSAGIDTVTTVRNSRVATRMLSEASRLHKEGYIGEAEQAYSAALKQARKCGTRSREHLEALVAMADFYKSLELTKDAEEAYSRAFAIFYRVYRFESTDYMSTRDSIASSFLPNYIAVLEKRDKTSTAARIKTVLDHLSPKKSSLSAQKPGLPEPETGDVDFGPYMADLQRRIDERWSPLKRDDREKIVCTFKINRTGTLSDLTLTRSSPSTTANSAALKAIESTAFRPLPQGAPPFVDIQFSFNVYR